MCLITEQKEPSIAQEDMTVYKLMYSGAFNMPISLFYSKRWNLGELNTEEIERSSDSFTFADSKSEGHIRENERWEADTVSYGKGFHFCESRERANIMKAECSGTVGIYQCTVPKGSEYYLDGSGLGVSNQIIVDKLVKEQ